MTSPKSHSLRPRGDRTFPSRGSYREALRIGELLRKESVGGLLLVAMAAVAIVWANSPWADSYFALRDFRVGYAGWHLDLSLGGWAADADPRVVVEIKLGVHWVRTTTENGV